MGKGKWPKRKFSGGRRNRELANELLNEYINLYQYLYKILIIIFKLVGFKKQTKLKQLLTLTFELGERDKHLSNVKSFYYLEGEIKTLTDL